MGVNSGLADADAKLEFSFISLVGADVAVIGASVDHVGCSQASLGADPSMVGAKGVDIGAEHHLQHAFLAEVCVSDDSKIALKLIAHAARTWLDPLGLRRKGQSRTWLDDHGWWLTIVELQAGAHDVGAFLNVGVCW